MPAGHIRQARLRKDTSAQRKAGKRKRQRSTRIHSTFLLSFLLIPNFFLFNTQQQQLPQQPTASKSTSIPAGVNNRQPQPQTQTDRHIHKMEIDSDIPHFLASQKQQAPASLQNYYNTFEDLYERKYVPPHSLLFFLSSKALFSFKDIVEGAGDSQERAFLYTHKLTCQRPPLL